MKIQEYKDKFKNELLDIVDSISEQVQSYKFDNNNQEATCVVCRPILISIFSMVESIYILMQYRKKIEIDILKRSLIEYLLDLTFLIANDDTRLNRNFINYHKLLLYWSSKNFSSQEAKEHIPRIAQEYRDYVLSAFPEIAEQYHIDTGYEWQKFDKKIRDKYKKSWSGKNTTERINKVMSTSEHMAILDQIFYGFQFYSNRTHPTPYGLPNFDPKSGTFSFGLFVADSSLYKDEQFVYSVSDIAIAVFSETLEKKQRDALVERFNDLVAISHKLKTALLALSRKTHESRSGH